MFLEGSTILIFPLRLPDSCDPLCCFICQKTRNRSLLIFSSETGNKSGCCWQFFNVCQITKLFVLIVRSQSDFLTSSSSSSSSSNLWSSRDLTPDEDLLDLDYMLALSLQNDGESMAGGVEPNYTFEKTFSTSVNPDFTPGTSPVGNTAQMGKHFAHYTLNLYVNISIIIIILISFL